MPPSVLTAMPFGVSYRPATDEDLPFLALLYASTRTEELAVTGWSAEVWQQFLASQFDAQHRHYRSHYPKAEWLVIEQACDGIGRIYLEEWDDQVRIIDIALLPGARGRGIGNAILTDILEDGRRAGKGVSLHVERSNPAMRLYGRHGFLRTAEHAIYDLLEWRPAPADD